MYVQSDQRATGLVRLLSIGLRVLTLLEWSCRQHLTDTKATVAGLYAGNPKRTTNRPTAEALLGAFKGIHLSEVSIGQQLHRHVTPLSEVQQHLLALLDLSPALYDQLCADFSKPT
jgi:transposase